MSEDEAKKSAPIFIEAQEMLLKWESSDKEVLNLWNKLNSWVYDDTLLGKMYNNINNNSQYGMTTGSVQYPFGPSYYRTISTSTNITGDVGIRILAFDEPFPDPRPSADISNSFKYEHLIKHIDYSDKNDSIN